LRSLRHGLNRRREASMNDVHWTLTRNG
jgi:hypothetical protein